jgi:hypothetical protein
MTGCSSCAAARRTNRDAAAGKRWLSRLESRATRLPAAGLPSRYASLSGPLPPGVSLAGDAVRIQETRD